jgi:hypothetical protein
MDTIDTQERMNLGMLILIDSLNKVSAEINTTFSTMADQVDALRGSVRDTTQALNKQRTTQQSHWDDLHQHLNQLFADTKAATAPLANAMQHAGGQAETMFSKLGDSISQAGAGMKMGMIMPLKAIPMQIGMLLIKPLMRLMDPFINVLEDLTLIAEPFTGVLESFLAPLQETIGLIAGDLAKALLGNKDTMRDVTAAGRQLATMLYNVWAMFAPVVNALAPLTPLLLQLGTLLYFVAQPLQALLAILGAVNARQNRPISEDMPVDYMPGERDRQTTNNYYFAGNVTTERQVNRGTMELMR